jgi:hypothetical protein
VANKKSYLSSALFYVQVAIVEAAIVGAEEDEFAGDVAAELHYCHHNRDHRLLDLFKVGTAQMVDRKGIVDAAEKDREVIYLGVRIKPMSGLDLLLLMFHQAVS